VLVHTLSVLFESFFSVGGVLTAWKATIITPLFKKGQSSDPSNYRTVSITSVFGKIMERVIASSMLQHLKQNNLLNDNQLGFLSKKSTLTNLLESVNDWSITLNNRNNAAVSYNDFQRAFDSVTHPKLAHKLKAHGIEGVLVEWFLNCKLFVRQKAPHSSGKQLFWVRSNK
jgi:Reverse transcriptase (RNA-dependent DNA polymerase)